jgi:hypothetical protein
MQTPSTKTQPKTRARRMDAPAQSERLTTKHVPFAGLTGGGNAKFQGPYDKGAINVTAYVPAAEYEALGHPTSVEVQITGWHTDEAPE